MKIKFYSRPNCSLCNDGLLVLKMVQEDVEFDIEIINIEDNEETHEKYMLMIPVVEKEGKIVQYGNLDYVTLLESLQ
ncbi:glutaredoxin-like protein DUF836 [Ureibacillus xyleni]|uniref:Glutaredoxin-like protein DUF836 n=1 Tax=Ureibacillus xyleni TaxID=614648 RepID=A0A285T792_9BACL|nr:glutaredoxin family protein [Ureibacillus xyleni]SOC17161.1 glutaredoxin-like protein DUF836 [Ureibacillus xyleni]